MKVSEIGEFGLIDILRKLVQESRAVDKGVSPGASEKRSGLLIGIGDDAAVWLGDGGLTLATTDTMVEDVHFKVGLGSWRDLGWKAMAVNISDIAAMGGEPSYALVTLGLPIHTEVEDIVELYGGIMEAASVYNVAIAGGDIVRSPCFMITVALTGHLFGSRPWDDALLLRSAASPGDLVAVTGYLGSSAGGLRCARGEGVGVKEDREYLSMVHLRPAPRVDAGIAARKAGVRCAMDVSDGTVADLSKLCSASAVSAILYCGSLPVHPSLKLVFPQDWTSLALYGGEDYELLLVSSEESISKAMEQAGVPVSIIGRIEAGAPGDVIVIGEDGAEVPWAGGGWDHLKDR
ncbi:MAG: thiamine-phosphate kinase [Dehalococcoidia bacterium]|nr:thiamine-phosphate kinase [Dehalococcoidia bacterium]